MQAKRDEKFTQVGETVKTLTVAAIESGAQKTLEVTFGSWQPDPKVKKDEDGNEVTTVQAATGRFEVRGESVIEGQTVPVIGYGPSAAVVVKRVVDTLYRPFGIDHADVDMSEFDEDDAFYKQKIEAPKDNVWKLAEFAGSVDRLNELRLEASADIERMAESESDAFAAALHMSQTIAEAFELVGRNMKRLQSWCLGEGEGAGNAAIAQLGKGVNALREGMYLAELSERELQVLPRTVTSGKAVDRHKRESLKYAVAATGMGGYKEMTFNSDGYAEPNALARMLRNFAAALGVGDVDVDLDALVPAVDAAAAEKAVTLQALSGGWIDTYNADMYAKAKAAFCAVSVSTVGSNTFKDAVQIVQDLAGRIERQEETKSTYESKVVGGKANPVLKYLHAAFKAHIETVAKDEKIKAQIEAAEETDGPISKQATKALMELPAEEFAAQLYAKLVRHADAAGAWAALTAMVKKTELSDPSVKQKAA